MQVCTRRGLSPCGLEGWIEAWGLRRSPSNRISIVNLIQRPLEGWIEAQGLRHSPCYIPIVTLIQHLLEGWIEAQGLRHGPSNYIPIVTLIQHLLEGWIEAQGLHHSPSNYIFIVTLIQRHTRRYHNHIIFATTRPCILQTKYNSCHTDAAVDQRL
jgi:hypothetical protein